MPRNRASGGYSGSRCAFLHNRSLWTWVRLSGCFSVANRLLGIKEQYGDVEQDGNRYRNIRSSLMLRYAQKQPSVDDDTRK